MGLLGVEGAGEMGVREYLWICNRGLGEGDMGDGRYYIGSARLSVD